MTPKDRFLRACYQKPVDRPPVWMMRQAGRYLPEYRAVRKQKSTMEMMKDPETACAITLQPVDLIGVDAAILYSDILMVPEAMGLKLDFVRGTGPVFENPVHTEKDIEKLSDQSIAQKCDFVSRTIQLIRKKIPDDFPLLGFAGAPFTVGAYMVGGDGSHDGNTIKKMAFEERQTFRHLMTKITHATIDYLKKQVEAGVDAVQLFDTWAGTFSVEDYKELALPYEREIFKSIRAMNVPTILYIKGGGPLFEEMVASGADVISIDWRLSLSEAKQKAQGRVALQGNLDPSKLYAPIPKIEESTLQMFKDFGKGRGYLVNLGHGIMPDIPVEHARAFVDYAKKFGHETIP